MEKGVLAESNGQMVAKVVELACSLHSNINHTLVEYFTFRLNAPFLHDLCKVDNCVVSVYKDFVSAEVAGTTV